MRQQAEYIHPRYLGWQMDWPLFVKRPFTAFGKYWKQGDYFEWQREVDPKPEQIAQLYASGFVHHNPTREIEEKLGDRLHEFTKEDFKTAIRLMNDRIKKQCVTDQQFNKNKVKQSTIPEKQIALVRSWLRNHPSLKDDWEEIRDRTLDKTSTESQEA